MHGVMHSRTRYVVDIVILEWKHRSSPNIEI